ncbi:hypothetical protein HY522_01865 [bacterium]|nr:hypothetical protein [bacterium]
MTFRESEFPNLLGQIDGIARSYPPEVVSMFIQELTRIYRAIPLYPGLVAMCMGKAFQKCGPKDIPAKGAFVVVRLRGGGAACGRVISWTPAAAQVEIRDAFGKLRRSRLTRKQIQSVEIFRTDTLEAFWPTLVFDRKPAPAKAKR